MRLTSNQILVLKRIKGLFIVYILFSFLVFCSDKSQNSPPIADFSVENTEVLVGEPVKFHNNSEDPGNNIVSYIWEFGDGNSSGEKNPVHTYEAPGSFEVTLTVVDEFDERGNHSLTIQVSYDSDIPGRISLRAKLLQMSDRMMVVAHRGCHNNHPENSVGAVETAIEEGIGMVEIDIRPTQDNVLVLMHDATINRTTNGSGRLNEMTFEELQQYNLIHNGQITNYKVPTLEEVLQVARGKIYIDLDIDQKSSATRVYEIVKKMGMEKQVLFYSKDRQEINRLLHNDNELVVLPYVGSEADFDYYTDGTNVRVLHYNNNTFNSSLINKARAKNVRIFMNAYVNSESGPTDDNFNQVKNLINGKGNLIQTDYPELIHKFLIENNKLD